MSTREAKLEVLCEGIAVGMLPEPLAEGLIRKGKLVARRIVGVREYSNCYLAWRRDKAGNALNWWIDQLDHADLISRLV